MEEQLDPWAEGVLAFRMATGGIKPSLIMYFAVVEGRAECVRIEIGKEFLPGEDPTLLGARFAPGRVIPLTTSTLRSINLHSEISRARKEWVETLDYFVKANDPRLTTKIRREARRRLPVARDAEIFGRPGLRPFGKSHFEEVALTYRDAHVRGEPPTQAVMEHFGTSHSTAARWVGVARSEYRLLPRTSRGKARSGRRRANQRPASKKAVRRKASR